MRASLALALCGLLTLPAGLSAAATSPGPKAPADSHVRRAAVTSRVSTALGASGELRGVALNDFGRNGRTFALDVLDFPRLSREGVNTVAVYIYLDLASPTSNDVATGIDTPTDQELQLVTSQAKSNGLNVTFMPVLLNRANTGVWRGGFVPSDINAFFRSYTTAVTKYASMAQQLGVSLFYVGSENFYIEKHTAQWAGVISAVRQQFSGALSYMAVPRGATHLKFWSLLDLAAIAPYYSLGEDRLPTYDRMMAAWREVNVPSIHAIARYAKKPVIFGEIGYRSHPGAYTNPGEGGNNFAAPAPQVQADAHRAMLDSLASMRDVYGVTLWRWQPASTPVDSDYSIAGKPAECVMASKWSSDPTVQQDVTLPVCDLSVLDQVSGTLPLLPGGT